MADPAPGGADGKAVRAAVVTRRVVCAPDKFRGSLSAQAASAALAAGARKAGFDAVEHPLADGGEGTMRIIHDARGGTLIDVTARDALGAPRAGLIARLDDGSVIVEAAVAIGLGLVAPAERDPEHAGSWGVGDLIRAALDAHATRILCCLGGSATIDGGLGMLAALGATLGDGDARELAGCGRDLLRIAHIGLEGLDPRLAATPITIALDVENPLSGPRGAAVVFGPQKGATPAQVAALDHGLRRLQPLLGSAASIRGAGAAGGLGAALAFLGGTPRVGADVVMAETGFHQALADAALCLTGEGRVDAQTTEGKTVYRVAQACARHTVPCFVLAGSADGNAAPALHRAGAQVVYATARGPASIDQVLADAAQDVETASEAVCRAFAAARTV